MSYSVLSIEVLTDHFKHITCVSLGVQILDCFIHKTIVVCGLEIAIPLIPSISHLENGQNNNCFHAKCIFGFQKNQEEDENLI